MLINQANTFIIKHIILILSFLTTIPECTTESIFERILASNYKNSAINFLYELIENPDIVIREVYEVSETKEKELKCVHKLECNTKTSFSEYLLKKVYQHEDFINYKAANIEQSNELKSYYKDKLLLGVIKLVTVISSLIFRKWY